MDEGTIKTPNPKCHLYWCLIQFIDCVDTVSLVGIFNPSCVLLPLYLLFDLPPFLKITYIIYRQCVAVVGWRWGGGVELCCRPYSAGD
jgi:hypothetical protein